MGKRFASQLRQSKALKPNGLWRKYRKPNGQNVDKLAKTLVCSISRSFLLRVNSILNVAKAIDIYVHITRKHGGVRMPKEFRKFEVTNFPNGIGGVGVAVRVHDDLLSSLKLNTGTLSESRHLPNEAVFGIWLAVLIQKDEVARLLSIVIESLAELKYRDRQWNYPRSWLTLSRDGLMLWKYPKAIREVDPLPDKLAYFTGSATGKAKSDKHSAEIQVGYAKQRLEFIRLDDSSASSSGWFFETSKWIEVNVILLDRPIEDTGHDDQCVFDGCRTVGTREFRFDFREMRFSNLPDSDFRAEDFESTKKSILGTYVRGRLTPCLNIRKILVGEFGKRGVEPFFAACRFAFDLISELFELAAREPVILVKVFAFAVDGGTPIASFGVVPRLIRTWSSHFEPPVKTVYKVLTKARNDRPTTRSLGYFLGYSGSVRVFQIDVNPYRVRVGATGFEPATSASRTQRSTKLSHAPFHQNRIV